MWVGYQDHFNRFPAEYNRLAGAVVQRVGRAMRVSEAQYFADMMQRGLSVTDLIVRLNGSDYRNFIEADTRNQYSTADAISPPEAVATALAIVKSEQDAEAARQAEGLRLAQIELDRMATAQLLLAPALDLERLRQQQLAEQNGFASVAEIAEASESPFTEAELATAFGIASEIYGPIGTTVDESRIEEIARLLRTGRYDRAGIRAVIMAKSDYQLQAQRTADAARLQTEANERKRVADEQLAANAREREAWEARGGMTAEDFARNEVARKRMAEDNRLASEANAVRLEAERLDVNRAVSERDINTLKRLRPDAPQLYEWDREDRTKAQDARYKAEGDAIQERLRLEREAGDLQRATILGSRWASVATDPVPAAPLVTEEDTTQLTGLVIGAITVLG